MKKLILLLFIFCSVFASAQISIPQVTGLPAALNSKVDKVSGKSLVADTSIVKLTGVQAGAQVNKIEGVQKNGIDLTITGKKVNITVPTTAAEIGAQPAGTYATGTGTAYNSNNGDETLTSIKTKLGAATSVSDGYLKYQDYVKFDGKLSSEVDGSTTNELQTISTTGAAGNITLSNSGGTLNLNVNDADASPTNEIQDLSLSGNTLTLSSDATTVDVSQSTAVQANTSKVSNATHTGDATGSTVLTLATVNSNVGTYNNVTINAKGLATAGSNVSYEPAITKNTAFNKNFGTTTGTVLEGRTFGTAANSAVGDFIQNQNSSAQSANMWISGRATINGNIEVKSGSQIKLYKSDNTDWATIGSDPTVSNLNLNGVIKIQNAAAINSIFPSVDNATDLGTSTLGFKKGYFKGGLDVSGAATFSSTVNSTGFLLNGNNLTSSLTTNYIPKWNGSSFVNSLISDDGSRTYMAKVVQLNDNHQVQWGNSTSMIYGSGANGTINLTGNIRVDNGTPSTTPTTGALVVNGGIGANHVRANNFYGDGSNLTGVQLPITLTTNGTSGAATLENGVMNVPNYSSNSVNQTLTTVNGSTGGDIVGSMPFQTANYKKVIVYVNFVSGNATYTFPTQFNNEYNLHTNTLGTAYSSVSVSGTSVTITGATNAAGVLIIEGY